MKSGREGKWKALTRCFPSMMTDSTFQEQREPSMSASEDGTTIDSDRVVLAPGNSARELFELFAARLPRIEAGLE